MKNNLERKTSLDLVEDFSLPKESEQSEFNTLLKKSPNTIQVALLKITQKNKYKPLTIEQFCEFILPEIDFLQRADGTKYVKSIKTIRSAVTSNKLYTKNKNGLYILNVKEAIKYLKRIQNIPIKNKIKKNNNDIVLLGKKTKNKNCINKKLTTFRKVYEILDNLLEIYMKDNELKKNIKIYFNKCNSFKDIIEKYHNNEDIIIGMLITFKYFRLLIKKFASSFPLKQCNRLNKINHRIDLFKEDLEFIHGFFNSHN